LNQSTDLVFNIEVLDEMQIRAEDNTNYRVWDAQDKQADIVPEFADYFADSISLNINNVRDTIKRLVESDQLTSDDENDTWEDIADKAVDFANSLLTRKLQSSLAAFQNFNYSRLQTIIDSKPLGRAKFNGTANWDCGSEDYAAWTDIAAYCKDNMGSQISSKFEIEGNIGQEAGVSFVASASATAELKIQFKVTCHMALDVKDIPDEIIAESLTGRSIIVSCLPSYKIKTTHGAEVQIFVGIEMIDGSTSGGNMPKVEGTLSIN